MSRLCGLRSLRIAHDELSVLMPLVTCRCKMDLTTLVGYPATGNYVFYFESLSRP